MIKSIIYPKNGKGYLSEKYEKPEKVNLKSKYVREADKTYYKEALANYKKYGNTYKRPTAAKLLGKHIEFVPDKINVLFGENASGKTTIINSLSALCNVSDGWSEMVTPSDFTYIIRDGISSFRKSMILVMLKCLSNSSNRYVFCKSSLCDIGKLV